MLYLAVFCLFFIFSFCFYFFPNHVKEISHLHELRLQAYQEGFEKGYETVNHEKPYEQPESGEPAVVSMDELMAMLSKDEEREEQGLVYQERRGSVYDE